MEHKFCKDCIYHKKVGGISRCVIPIKYDLVTGEVEAELCSIRRLSFTACGPEGKHWKNKEKPWWRFW